MGINCICCMGADQLGVPLCAVMALKCPEIRFVVLDKTNVILDWNSDNLPYYEPDLENIVKKCRNRNLFFNTDYSVGIQEADLIFVSINVPAKAFSKGGEKAVDFKQLEDAARLIASNSTSDKIIVEKSTLSTKSIERLSMIFNSISLPGVKFQVISCPQFLTEGSAIHDLLFCERVLIGIMNNPKSRLAAQALSEVYERWVPLDKIVIVNIKSAELAKLAANAFLAQRLSSVNSLAQICETAGGDISEITKILGEYSKIGPKYLHASLGFGGFNKEISSLVFMCESIKLLESARYWQAILDINEAQKRRFTEKIGSILMPLKGKEIAVWGFSYKKNTSDTKYSPAIEICSWLLTNGAKVKIFDPKVQKARILSDLEMGITAFRQRDGQSRMENVSLWDDPYQACENTEAVILCTDWDEFQKLHFSKVAHLMKKPILFDGKRFLDPIALRNSGVELYSVGLGGSP